MDETVAALLASNLLGENFVTARRATGGGNNRIFALKSRGRQYAFKVYPRLDLDPRDRLAHEFAALTFLPEHGFTNVPRALAQSPGERFGIYEWIEGTPVGARDATDVDALIAMAGALHAASRAPDAANLPDAVEAVWSPQELIAQLELRISRLRKILDEPVLQSVVDEIEAAMRAFAARLLEGTSRTLSPSDFGFHNALRRPGGSLAFLDFEYFGWDDPVKLTSDVLWHPGHQLTEPERLQFRAAATELYKADRAFEARLSAAYPLYGLRWALIALNDFLPVVRARRRFAGEVGERHSIEERQLAKARDLLARARAL